MLKASVNFMFEPNSVWRMLENHNTRRIKPNEFWFYGDTAALVIFQSQTGDDFSLSKAGLEYAMGLFHDRNIKHGHVVLVRKIVPRLVVAYRSIIEVAHEVEGISPRDGEYGPYWWLNKHARYARSLPSYAVSHAPWENN